MCSRPPGFAPTYECLGFFTTIVLQLQKSSLFFRRFLEKSYLQYQKLIKEENLPHFCAVVIVTLQSSKTRSQQVATRDRHTVSTYVRSHHLAP